MRCETTTTAKPLADSKLNIFSEFSSTARRAWHPRSKLLVRLLRVHTALVQLAAARTDLAVLHRHLGRCFKLQKHWWQELETLDSALTKAPNRPSWYFRRGQVREHMSQFRAAAEDYGKAITLRQARRRMPPADWHYRKAYALSCATPSDEALSLESSQAYNAAIDSDSRLGASRLGVGVFHQKRGYWPEAAMAYAAQAAIRKDDPLLLYHWGLAAEHCWDWETARQAYAQALEQPSAPKSAVFRHGYVLERLGHFGSAAEHYRQALSIAGQSKSTIYYRLGCALAGDQQWEASARAFVAAGPRSAQFLGNLAASCSRMKPLRMLADKLSQVQQRRANSRKPLARKWLVLGLLNECAGSAARAAAAYDQGEALLSKRSTFWLARRADNLRWAGSFPEACQLFRMLEPEPLFLGHAANTGRRKKKEALVRASYAIYLDSLPVREKTVLFESYFGSGITCNPYAIFRHMQRRPEYRDWKFAWVVDETATIPPAVSEDPRVLFVRREGDAYRRYLASARFLVSNSTFPPYFVRRPEQLYLNTWHGTPLKTMGRDIKSTFMERVNTARNFLHATHLLSPNPHTSRVLLERYDVKDIFDGQLLETGYPRIDRTLDSDEQARAALRRALGISPTEKVVLYAPTWRGRLGQSRSEHATIEGVLRCLSALPCRVLFRGHYFAENSLRRRRMVRHLVPSDIDTNELLSIVDVLVTDYSSIFFDYLPTGRPICFYAYDLEDYENERGLYFPLSEMPGDVFRSPDSLAAGVRSQLSKPREPDAAYMAARTRFCPHEDGSASQRAVDAFFSPRTAGLREQYPPRKTSLLFYPGALMPNGITTSFQHLSSHLTNRPCSAAAIIDTEQVARFRERREQLDRVSPGIQLLGRVGRMAVTQEEWAVVRYFNKRHRFASAATQEIYRNVFRREYRRLFGDARFDALIEFAGYSVYWASVLGNAPSGRKVIYQHNDMASEWQRRFPSLEGVFRAYVWYNQIVAVSTATMDLNRKHLAAAFDLQEDRFTACRNLQNPTKVLRQSTEPLTPAEEKRFFADDRPVFITVGRLSIEKDHAKLIRAFAALRYDYPRARLLILGDGPLRSRLLTLISELDQVGHIDLLGHQSNPFKWLSRASCFVLPSNYEGQPMVLFEALILGKPIIATDITGNRSVVDEQTALMVENSESGLRRGLEDYLSGRVVTSVFDISDYNQQAMDEFLRVALPAGIVKQRLAA
jgi:CDP-glycerol glycerophosphotransferase